jgi:predicted lipoprotein with Yx(FWY)xxD motif
MSTKFTPIVALFAALALVTAGVALAAAVTVKSKNNATLGKVVVNSSGKTLYRNTKEKKGLIKCTGSCAVTWPPLLVGKNAKLKAGLGIKAAKLGKIKRPNGRFQVTYYGHPLYRYAGDSSPGNVNGEGLGGIWFALKTNGALAKTTSTSTATTTTTTTSTTGY